jgi:hypothetical protein
VLDTCRSRRASAANNFRPAPLNSRESAAAIESGAGDAPAVGTVSCGPSNRFGLAGSFERRNAWTSSEGKGLLMRKP